MKNRKIIPAILLAALVLFAGVAWVVAKAPVTDPENESISPAEVTMERILAANHPSTLLRSDANFLLEFDGEEKYQCYVEDGIVLKEDTESDESAMIVDREYVVRRQGEDYSTVAVSDSDFQGSWYADLILNTSLLLKESIVSTAEENGDLIVTTSLSGEDYDNHYNRAEKDTASCTTVYTLDSASCRVKSVTQTATLEDGNKLVNTLTLTENVTTPATVSAMSAKSSYTAAASTDNFKLDKNGDYEINILFIGNSYSCYWTDELYFLLKEAGYDKAEDGKDVTINVCNLYRSGADFIDHWEEYERGVSNFKLYTIFNGNYDDPVTGTYADSRNKKIPHDPNARDSITCGLLHALNYKNWDIISFQQGNDNSQSEPSHRNSIEKHFPLLYDLATSYCPDARYYWQQDWPHEYFDERSKSLEAVQTYRKVGLEVCREYDLINAPLGDAWQIIEHDPMFFKYDKNVSEHPIYSLHSRLWHASSSGTAVHGQIYQGDDSHDGDVGGGQYLNACVWFEILTRTRVQDTAAADYIPAYRTGTDEQIARGAYYIGMRASVGEYARVPDSEFESVKGTILAAQAKLQDAAHTAVVASYGEDFFID